MNNELTLSPLPETTELAPIPRDAQNRRDLYQFSLEQSQGGHRPHLLCLWQTWRESNARFYGDQLEPPYLLIAEPRTPSAYGDCGNFSSFGGTTQIRIRPSLLSGTHPVFEKGSGNPDGFLLFAADVLLHEMIHQYHFDVTGRTDKSYSGHGPAFRDECNRIGEILGLPPVRICKKRGPDAELPSCSLWPHNVRPEAYYLGVAPVARASPVSPILGTREELKHATNTLLELAREVGAAHTNGADETGFPHPCAQLMRSAVRFYHAERLDMEAKAAREPP